MDINPSYIASASARYQGKIPGLELYLADIQSGPLAFGPVDLIYAALVFEYVSLSAALSNLSRVCRPGGRLVSVLQQPSPQVHALRPHHIGASRSLRRSCSLIPPTEFAECAAKFGFALESEKTLVLGLGKEFSVLAYRRAVD